MGDSTGVFFSPCCPSWLRSPPRTVSCTSPLSRRCQQGRRCTRTLASPRPRPRPWPPPPSPLPQTPQGRASHTLQAPPRSQSGSPPPPPRLLPSLSGTAQRQPHFPPTLSTAGL